MKIFQVFIIFMLLTSSNVFSTEAFKCILPNGKNVFSDKPCPKDAKEQKVTYKDQSWQSALEASKPDDIKIIDVKAVDGDTLITYQFINSVDSNNFLKLAHNLSKQNVNLLKFKSPVNGEKGEAVIQVTKKESNIFKEK